jgi:DNA-binding NarL/FixJ family response regulator
MIYIGIVDDKSNIRDTLKDRLSRFEGFKVLFTAENGKVFLEMMKECRKSIEPSVVLMDIDMPVMNGIEAILEGKLRFPNTCYLVLTIFDEDEKIFDAIKAGADGYLLKDEPVERIKEAIENLMNGEGAPMSPSIARKVLNLLGKSEKKEIRHEDSLVKREYHLTEREKEILGLLVEGFEYKEIAAQLGLSPNTIRNTVTKIYSKLHVTSKMQAAKVVGKNFGA